MLHFGGQTIVNLLRNLVKERLNATGKSQTRIAKESHGRITQSLISAILVRDTIPRDLDILDELATLLETDPKVFRVAAGTDNVHKILQHYELVWDDLSKSPSEEVKTAIGTSASERIPVYPMDRLIEHLSSTGLPIKQSKETLAMPDIPDRGTLSHPYAVHITDERLKPVVRPGNVVIMSESRRAKSSPIYDDYGLVYSTANKEIYFGQLIHQPGHIVVGVAEPHSWFQVPAKDIGFTHSVRIVVR